MKKGGVAAVVQKPAKTTRKNTAEKKIQATAVKVPEKDQISAEKSIKQQAPQLPRRPLIVFPK